MHFWVIVAITVVVYHDYDCYLFGFVACGCQSPCFPIFLSDEIAASPSCSAHILLPESFIAHQVTHRQELWRSTLQLAQKALEEGRAGHGAGFDPPVSWVSAQMRTPSAVPGDVLRHPMQWQPRSARTKIRTFRHLFSPGCK